MSAAAAQGRAPEPARHELGDIDAAALAAGAAVERALRAATELGFDRWVRFLGSLPERLRDGSLREVRAAARQARAAYGPKDSIRDSLPEDITEPLLLATDRLLKALARWDAHRS
jgi:hypothetical protein